MNIFFKLTSGTEICQYSYSNTILAVKLNRARLVVCLEESLYIHNIRDMKVRVVNKASRSFTVPGEGHLLVENAFIIKNLFKTTLNWHSNTGHVKVGHLSAIIIITDGWIFDNRTAHQSSVMIVANLTALMKVLHTIRDTPPNPRGLCTLSINSDNCYLAYPGSTTTGEVQLFDAFNLQVCRLTV